MNIAFCEQCDPPVILGVNVGDGVASHNVGETTHSGRVIVLNEDAQQGHNESPQVYMARLARKYAALLKDLRGQQSFELTGGLGDVLYSLHYTTKYTGLMSLGPDESRSVVLLTHNPHTTELFEWHPKAAQLDILHLGHVWDWDDGHRARHRLPRPMPNVHREPEPLTYYPAPSDHAALEELAGLTYIAFFLTGSGNGRGDIPTEKAELAADAAITAGFTVVVCGRNYRSKMSKGTEQMGWSHFEPQLRARLGVIRMVDRLTVPGTMEALRGAAGVLCAHSAMCLGSWLHRRPTFVSIDEGNPMFRAPVGYAWGRDYPETRHYTHRDWSTAQISEWLSCVKAGKHPDKPGAKV